MELTWIKKRSIRHQRITSDKSGHRRSREHFRLIRPVIFKIDQRRSSDGDEDIRCQTSAPATLCSAPITVQITKAVSKTDPESLENHRAETFERIAFPRGLVFRL